MRGARRHWQISAVWMLGTGFRLGIWLLLTSDFSRFNLLAGLALALLLPRSKVSVEDPSLLLGSLWRVLRAVPSAYGEALLLIVRPHRSERLVIMPGSGSRSALVMFLEVFHITLTPLTIALGRLSDGSYLVHRLERGAPR
ncbi:cation:proton antiporter [Synechococcus sp. CBW1107]|jgi:multicomponent Na+:H+ antiporter subunit E|nr:cation:proton antiporter [Synechococcus sp. CBW1107]